MTMRLLIVAESVAPLATLTPRVQRALRRGRAPLGAVLDQAGTVRSGTLATARVSTGEHAGCWARRAVLHVPGAAQLLLTEVFLPALWRLIDTDSRALA